ncbi:MAG: cache domain-containing protein [Prolixibacteraceae bacterium]|nr:cache domain-containing protein [Prolixibacteraceae bacterium]
MSKETNIKFYFRIVLPSVLAIILFVVSIFIFILPAFEKSMLRGKNEMINQLTNTAWSVLDEYRHKVNDGLISVEEAQRESASIIELMRYGQQHKDYFWIIDTLPSMIMHPYRPELNGKDLREYKDPEGTFLFREAVAKVKTQGEGFIRYIWQWKDDSTRMVPKLSYVKSYPEWGWVIGTGIYLDDVADEIKVLRNKLLRLSLIIMLIITIALFYIMRQSLFIERERKNAEENLKLSRHKYKSLVEASTEGTLMMLGGKIIFANLRLANMLGSTVEEIMKLKFEDLFGIPWGEVLKEFSDPNKSVAIETPVKFESAIQKEVILSVSRVEYDSEEGYIVIAKDISRQKRIEKGTEDLNRELQMSLLLMNQPIKPFIRDIVICDSSTTLMEAAGIMTRKSCESIFVRVNDSVIGSVTDGDLRARALAKNLQGEKPVSEIMTSPVVAIQDDALLFEALLLFKNEGVSHLLVQNHNGENVGMLNYKEVLDIQYNSVDFTIKEIIASEDVASLVKINSRTPAFVNALLESGEKTDNITRVITSVSDALCYRLIELTIEKLGPPPCGFAFISLGSEGRKEQTLSTDQDNAIILEDLEGVKLENAQVYFKKFANDVNNNLNRIGFRFCPGEIMARNPKWTQPLEVWKGYFTNWITNSDPQSILDSSIFFDLRCLYGDFTLFDSLKNHVLEKASNQSVFFQHMALPITKFRSRLSMFGSIVSDHESGESKEVDIKKIQLPIIGFARIYALKNKLKESNTLQRLKRLQSLNIINDELYREITVSYSVLMQLRLRSQANAIMNNQAPGNMVDINSLTAVELATLKKVLSVLSELQVQLNFDFKGTS